MRKIIKNINMQQVTFNDSWREDYQDIYKANKISGKGAVKTEEQKYKLTNT